MSSLITIDTDQTVSTKKRISSPDGIEKCTDCQPHQNFSVTIKKNVQFRCNFQRNVHFPNNFPGEDCRRQQDSTRKLKMSGFAAVFPVKIVDANKTALENSK